MLTKRAAEPESKLDVPGVITEVLEKPKEKHLQPLAISSEVRDTTELLEGQPLDFYLNFVRWRLPYH